VELSAKNKPHLALISGKEPFYWDFRRKPPDGNLNVRLLSGWELDLEHLHDSMMTKLLGVAQHNQLEWLKDGIRRHIPLDLIHPEGHTVLTIAAQYGSLETMDYLLDLGLNPAFYVATHMQYNAYFAACAGGQYEAVKRLLVHPSKKIRIGMEEPRHHQSGLQVAVHNTRFDFAKQLINDYPELLSHCDSLGRTVFGTALSIFITSTFITFIQDKTREKELESFCLEMLSFENPFQKMSDEAVASIEVLLNPVLSTFDKANKEQRMTAENAVILIQLLSPQLGSALIKLAQNTSHEPLAQTFLAICDKSQGILHRFKSQLQPQEK